ncbi:MAG: hypothetical protein HWD86_10425 [Kangiellaceae bacterium]|nr:hypothetical protein [Kangiellaceae bacterium]
MRYVIGALIGVVVSLSFLAAWYYLHYEQNIKSSAYVTQSNVNQSDATPSIVEPSTRATPLTQVQGTTRYSSRPRKVPQSNTQPTVLYKYKNSNGNWVFSSKKSQNNRFAIEPINQNNLTIVEMEQAQPVKKRKARKVQYARSSSGLSKYELKKRNNNTNCRWLVGKAYDDYHKMFGT